MTPDEARAKNEELLRVYNLTFATAWGKAVVADLSAYCRGAETCFHENDRTHAFLEGRRDVLLRIQHFTKLTEDEILQLRLERSRPEEPNG